MSNSQPKTPGRPPQYVQFKGRIIQGLSGPKSPLDTDGRYYSSHNDPNTGRREYFGRNKAEAVKLFKAWNRRLAKQRKRT